MTSETKKERAKARARVLAQFRNHCFNNRSFYSYFRFNQNFDVRMGRQLQLAASSYSNIMFFCSF